MNGRGKSCQKLIMTAIAMARGNPRHALLASKPRPVVPIQRRELGQALLSVVTSWVMERILHSSLVFLEYLSLELLLT